MIRSAAVVAILILILSLLACGTGDNGQSDDPDGGGRRFLSMGTAPVGGAFYVVGGAIGEVLNEHGAESWEVTAEATKGSQENIRRLDAGQIDIALSNAAITYFAVRGASGWDREYPMRTIMTLAPNVALFIAPANGSIRTIADLKGRRVYLGPDGAGFEYFVGPIVEAHGLKLDDFRAIYGSQSAAVDMLADGNADAAFLGGAVPTASITQAATTQEIVFVPFDETAKLQLSETFVFFAPATIPAGTYRGQQESYEGLDVGSMHLITSADQSDELVYRITKTVYENREAVTEKHAAGRAINERNVVRDTGTPFHPGAIRYYREIGIWPEERGDGA